LSIDVPDDVLAEDNTRPALFGDPADFRGEEALSLGPGTLSGI